MEEYYLIVHDPDSYDRIERVRVTKEIYQEFYRYVWRERKRHQRDGSCKCPQRFLWMCDADCDRCRYHKPGTVLNNDQDIADDSRAVTDKINAQHDLSPVLQKISKQFPEAFKVGEMKVQGKTERQALRELEIPRSTYRSRIKKYRQQLLEEFGEDVLDY